MRQPFSDDDTRAMLSVWRCRACNELGWKSTGAWRWNGAAMEHRCGDVPQAGAFEAERLDAWAEIERLAADRDAALADAEALRLAAQAYFTTIDNAPPFGAGDLALREHDAACDKTAHTLAVLAGARGPR